MVNVFWQQYQGNLMGKEQMVLEQLGIYMQKNQDPYLSPHAKLNWKGITELNVRVKTPKFLEVKRKENLTGLGKDFLDTKQKAQNIKLNK